MVGVAMVVVEAVAVSDGGDGDDEFGDDVDGEPLEWIQSVLLPHILTLILSPVEVIPRHLTPGYQPGSTTH